MQYVFLTVNSAFSPLGILHKGTSSLHQTTIQTTSTTHPHPHHSPRHQTPKRPLLSTNPQHQTSYPAHFLSSKSPLHQSLTNPASQPYIAPRSVPTPPKGARENPREKPIGPAKRPKKMRYVESPFLVVHTAQAYTAQHSTAQQRTKG